MHAECVVGCVVGIRILLRRRLPPIAILRRPVGTPYFLCPDERCPDSVESGRECNRAIKLSSYAVGRESKRRCMKRFQAFHGLCCARCGTSANAAARWHPGLYPVLHLAALQRTPVPPTELFVSALCRCLFEARADPSHTRQAGPSSVVQLRACTAWQPHAEAPPRPVSRCWLGRPPTCPSLPAVVPAHSAGLLRHGSAGQ